MTFVEEFGEFRSKAGHLLSKGFAIVLLLRYTDIASGREDIILLGYLIECRYRTETFLVLQRTGFELTERIGDTEDVLLGQFTQFARDHRTHIACIDKEHFVLLFLIAVDEPKADRNTGRIEKRVRHSHNTFH